MYLDCMGVVFGFSYTIPSIFSSSFFVVVDASFLSFFNFRPVAVAHIMWFSLQSDAVN